MAENKSTINVETVFIWTVLPDRLATRRAIEAAKPADPVQAKAKAGSWAIIGTSNAK